MKRRSLQRLSLIFFIAALVTMSYAGWHLLSTEISIQQSKDLWATALSATETLSASTDNQANSNTKPNDAANTPTEGPSTAPQALTPLQVTDNLYGLFTLDRLNLSLPIVKGYTDKDLEKGIVYIEQTVPPGTDGNSLLLGHRDTVFKDLKRVKLGDTFVIESRHGKQTFKVVDLLIVDPDDPRIIQPSKTPKITLVTCYPFHFIGNSPQRYLVICDLVP